MKDTTIRQLNKLNHQFYQHIADDFADSRRFFWPGWFQLTPILDTIWQATDEHTPRILDIGCGTGRWAAFLSQHMSPNFTYVGIDNSTHLLSHTQHVLPPGLDHHLLELDIVTELQEKTLRQTFHRKALQQPFDVICVFGFLHHVPSYQLRQYLLEFLATLLSPHGVLITTFWQFTSIAHIKRKIVDPSSQHIDATELERGDYLLDWKRGRLGIRYCHLADQNEIGQLIHDLNMPTVTQFLADGKTNDLNQYVVWQSVENEY